ncbi:DHHW family protein [Clostridium faecium]|uniref:DHHW family protein n=1 Tax=uncultured Clostridium sp. TaxID=59620 RepID=UPI0024BB6A55|nr:DHHW family protein [Clostridium butanoliproducens]MDU1348499.1 DHHW family protein [Clostridium argentinense]
MNRYDKVYKYIMSALLLLFIGGIVILNVLTSDKIFSDSENRNLEQLPKFSFKNLMKGKFTTNYEKYVSDQFALRDFWIGVKSDSDRIIGKKENNDVYLGKDGFLIQKFNKPEDKDLKDKVEIINSFDNLTPNVNKYFMLVPTATKILEDKLPNYAADSDELTYIDKVKKSINSNINFVDLYDALSSKKDEYIFYKTDHHWTTKGAYYAYTELSKKMGVEPKSEEDFNMKKVTDEFYGSLYSKGGFRHINPDSINLYLPKDDEEYKVEYLGENKIRDSLYDMNNINKKDKYTVFFNGNYPFIKITTNKGEGRKLLVIKDSYANSFIPFLTSHFSEIYMVDLRYYSEGLSRLIEENQINDMLILYNANTFFEDISIKNLSN